MQYQVLKPLSDDFDANVAALKSLGCRYVSARKCWVGEGDRDFFDDVAVSCGTFYRDLNLYRIADDDLLAEIDRCADFSTYANLWGDR